MELLPHGYIFHYTGVPNLREESDKVLTNLFIMGKCHQKIELRYKNIKWISDAAHYRIY